MKLQSTEAMRRAGGRGRAGGRVQRKALPGEAIVANHVSADAGLERQADEAAGRVLAGETNVARVLTPAPTARADVPTSTAEPLPANVRAEMETAFGADLEAVRIHRDSPGRAAARSEQAAAFAAGRHIFFGEGRFDPSSHAGRHLLAHELAHVLQQTGRRESVDLVHVTDRSGDGGIQLDNGDQDSEEKKEDVKKKTGREAIKFVVTLHKDGKPANSERDSMILKVESLMGTSTPLLAASSAGDQLAQIVKDKKEPKDPEALSFLYDILKVLRGAEPGNADKKAPYAYWDAAATLLDRDKKFEIRSLILEDFSVYLLQHRSQEWVMEGYEHPEIKPWWDDAFATWVKFIIDPYSTPPPLWGKGKSWKDHKKEIDDQIRPAGRGTGKMLFSDRIGLAFDALDIFNNDREKKMWGLLAEAKKVNDRRSRQRLHIARRLEAGALEDLPFANKVMKPLIEKLRFLGKKGIQFWKRSVELEDSFKDKATKASREALANPREKPEDVEKDLKLWGAVKKTTEVLELETILTEQARKVFARDKDKNVPTPWKYNDRLNELKAQLGGATPGAGGFVKRLTELNNRLFQRLFNSFLEADLPAEFREISFVLSWVANFLTYFPSYEAAQDTSKFPDRRLHHRAVLADVLLRLALFAGFNDLRDLARGVFTAEGEDSYIALTEDWKEEKGTPYERLLNDYSSNGVVNLTSTAAGQVLFIRTAITFGHLVNFFRLAYLRELNQNLEAIVEPELKKKNRTRYDKIDVKSAESKARKLPRPVRWSVKGYGVVTNPKKKLPLPEMIKANPKTTKQLPKPHERVILRDNTDDIFPEIFAWVLPDLSPLVAELKKIATIKKIVDDYSDDAAPTDAMEWIIALSEAARAENLYATIKKDIDDYFKSDTKGIPFEIERKRATLRKLTAIRRRIALLGITEELGKYQKDPKSYNVPGLDNAFRLMIEFHGNVEPLDSSEAQMAALMLQAGDTLDKTYTDAHKDQIAPELERLLDYGIKHAEDAKLKPALEAVLVHPDDNLNTTLGGLAGLKNVHKRLQDAKTELQAFFGFKSDGKSIGALRKKVTEVATDVEPGEVFEFDGIKYILHEIYAAFVYHPPLTKGNKPSVLKGTDGKDIPVSERKGRPLFKIQIIEEGGELPAGARSDQRVHKPITPDLPGADPVEEEPLTQEEKDERAADEDATDTFLVTDRHDNMLTHMAHVIQDRTLQVGMERLGIGIEIFGETIMLGAEILLPGGSAVGAARTAIDLAKIADDDEFKDLITRLTKDPEALVTELKAKIEEILTPEALWEFFIFGNPVIDKLAEIASQRDPKKKLAAPRGKLGKIFRFIIGIGKAFLRAFNAVKRAFHKPIARLNSAIVTRPPLAWLVMKGAGLLEEAIEVAENIPAFKKQVAEQAQDFGKEVLGFVDTLAHLELPEELIPPEHIIKLVVDFLISKIPRAKLLGPFLEKTGATLKIAEWVKKNTDLKDTVFDVPNKIYREEILSRFQKDFVKVRDDFVKELYAIINAAGALVKDGTDDTGLTIAAPDVPTMQIKTAPTMELSPFFSSELDASGESFDLHAGGGRRLGGALRHDAESRFDQDFGHVRVHSDASADRVTRSIGADAVTSGSHVFMRPDLPPTHGHGQRVLSHELAHVVQQTGARQLGGGHSDEPSLGEPGRGLRFEPAAEVAADRASREVSHAGAAALGGGAVPPPAGVQPNFRTDVLPRIVQRLTKFRSERDFEETAATGDVEAGDKTKAYNLWHQVRALLTPTGASFADFLTDPADLKKQVTDHVKNKVTEQDPAILAVAALGLKNVGPRPKPGEKRKRELDVPAFVTLLEGFLFARTGIAMQIKQRKGVVSKVHLGYVHLAFIGGTSKLWEEAMKTEHVDPLDAKKKLRLVDTTLGETEAVIQREVRARLNALGPLPFIWKTSAKGFRFSVSFVRDFRKLLADRAAAKEGKVTDVPKHGEYAKTNYPPGQTKSQDGQGLRVGLHGALTAMPNRTGRQSHHTTQFLLVEFLRNRHDKKAFPPELPQAEQDLVGIKHESGPHISSLVVAGTTFKLRDLDPKDTTRGDGMAAISLAAETHQRGGLHISTADEETKSPTQAGKAEEIFFGKMKTGDLQKYPPSKADWVKHIRADAAAVQKEIKDAANAFYSWMYYKKMQPPLKPALETHEKAYYEGIAARDASRVKDGKLISDYVLSKSDIKGAADAAHKQNEAVMEAAGFKKV